MDNEVLLKELQLDDLQEQHRPVAEAIGLEAMIKLTEYCGGTQIYIPKPFELTKELIYRKISADFDGSNIRQLAIKYRVSESTVYRIVKDQLSDMKRAPLEGQLSFL
jgi:Mor family transcriptional regulator